MKEYDDLDCIFSEKAMEAKAVLSANALGGNSSATGTA